MSDEIEHSETSNENRSSWWIKQFVIGIAWLHIVVIFALFVCSCIQTAWVGNCSQEALYLYLGIALAKLAELFSSLYAWWCDSIPYRCLRSQLKFLLDALDAAIVQVAPRTSVDVGAAPGTPVDVGAAPGTPVDVGAAPGTPVDVGAAPGTSGQGQVASDKKEGVAGTILLILIALVNIAAEVVELLQNKDPEKDTCTAKSTGPGLRTGIFIITNISLPISAILAGSCLRFFIRELLERRANAQPAAQADIELQDMNATQQTEE